MTNTEKGLLRSICERPDDTFARLVYADWLEERGETERAEFIRVSCELDASTHGENVRAGNYDATDGISSEWRRLIDLRDRERHLHNKLNTHWPWPFISVHGMERTYRRGFVKRIECTARNWLEHGPAIVARQPIREVRLVDRVPHGISLLDNYWGWWSDDNFEQSAQRIPNVWFMKLKPPLGIAYYHTRDEAISDLSRVALAWAREAAGLPEWAPGGGK